MYRVSLEIFGRMKVEIILVSRRERNKENGGVEEVSAYSAVMSMSLTIMWCIGGKGSKKWLGMNTQKYGGKEWKWPFIRLYFWYFFRVVWCPRGVVKTDRIHGVVLYGLL